MNTDKIVLRCMGEDFWGRIVFKGSNGKFYKTADILNSGETRSPEWAERVLGDLHTSEPSTDPEGEPGYPVNKSAHIIEPV